MNPEQPREQKPRLKRQWTRYLSAALSIEAIAIAGGLIIGAIMGNAANSAFEDNLSGRGFAYYVTAVVCALMPIVGVIYIHVSLSNTWSTFRARHRNRKL